MLKATDFTIHPLSPDMESLVEAFLQNHNPFDALFFRSSRPFSGSRAGCTEILGSYGPNGELLALLKLTSECFAERCYVLWDEKEALAPLIEQVRGRHTRVRTSGQVHQIEPFLASFRPDEITFRQEGTACVLTKDAFQPHRFPGVRKAGLEDIDRVLWLFSDDPSGERVKLEDAMKHAAVFVLEVDSRIVSTARTDVETSGAAHIVGVATHPAFQNKGYATYCTAALCEGVLTRCERIFLAYAIGNDAAGRVYEKIGFVPLPEKRVRARLRFNQQAL
jgi:ribosomal protein S18 acetylase RimI-like enzyme